VKHAQRTSFRLNPIAAAVAVALTAQFAANVAQAGSGFGSGLTVTNAPASVPTYYANSPAGPVPVLSNGGPGKYPQQTIRADGSLLPTMDTTGTALRKFVDPLKLFGAANANVKGQYIPVAVPEKWVDSNGVTTTDDYYEIAAVEFTEQLHSDLPKATKLRGYVQVASDTMLQKNGTGSYIALTGVTDPSRISATNTTGQVYLVDNPHHLGPVVNATKGTAVRVKFSNYLPVGGKLFVPVDTTITGAGMGPDGKTPYTENRAEIHLVGAQAPWISAGTPHQWVAPAGETAAYTAGIGKGASTQNVPDMADPGPGSVTLFFPNDMSARFTFYQDSTSGLTRLNSYVGLEAGYVVTDPIENILINGGLIGAVNVPAPSPTGVVLPAATLPLIFEDKTFVPHNVAQQDALWNNPAWGVEGDLWFPHVYEPNQDPTQASGANPVGRWDYGPLFWPLAPVSPSKATLPSPSFTPEAYMDTPLVNGTAYPTVNVEPKAYRVRLLNASNDRYLNLGFYVADATVKAPVLDANGNPTVNSAGVQQFMLNTEVKMVPAAPIDALGSPPGWDVVNGVQLPAPQFIKTRATATTPAVPYFPWHINAEPSGPTRAWPVDGRTGGSPDPLASGPDFVVIGNDGGFLPGAVDIPSQPITYEQNRRSITVLNIYGYGMLLGPAERADTIVDFTPFAGKTLILFNDAPSPTPFSDPRNDYYTGDPDQTGQGGAYTTQPGYGPNTRTVMQVVVGTAVTSGGPLNPAALAAALPAAYGASQPQPLVTESVYNAAFGTNNVDTFGRVATGSAAQPTMAFSHTGNLTLGVTPAGLPYVDPVSGSKGFTLVTSGGVGTGSGTGYMTAPQVVLSPPQLPNGVQATAVALLNAKNQVAQVNLLNPGSGYTAAPTVTFLSDSTVSGVTVVAGGAGYATGDTLNFSGGGGINAAGKVSAVTISAGLSLTPANLQGGAGYTLPPTVTLNNVGAAPTLPATVTATLSSSSLVLGASGVTAMTPTTGYSLSPVVTVSAPQVAGITATGTPIIGYAAGNIAVPVAGIAPSNGATQFETHVDAASGNTVSSAAITFSSPQLLPASGVPDSATGTVTVDVATGLVTAITINHAGSGYTSAPTGTILDLAGNQATVAGTLAAGTGTLQGVNIVNAGSGYTAPATVTVTDATGPKATATAAVLFGGIATYAPIGVVQLTINNPGQGYTAAPTVQFNTVGAVPTTAATATLSMGAIVGSIASVTITNPGSGYTSAPAVTVSSVGGSGANLSAGLNASGVGAQAAVVTSTTSAPVVMTKAEQELWDDYGRYNSTGGVELPYTTAAIQTTVPLSYIDSPTEVIGDGETQIWKLVDNGFWSNSIHFNMANVQLINRVGWDGTVKAPASNEVGWKDTLRLNPLEDVIVAVQGKRATVPFGQPRSTRLQDPSTPSGTPTAPAAPAVIPAGTFAPGLGFLADTNVVQLAGLMATTTPPGNPADKVVPVNTVLLQTTTNTNILPGSPTGNYDNEFLWGTAVLGHATNDFQRPVVFNPTVVAPLVSSLSDPKGDGTLVWTDPTPAGQVASLPNVVPVLAATLANPQNEIGWNVQQAAVTNVNSQTIGAWAPFAALPANTVTTKEPAALVSPTPPNGIYYAYKVSSYNAAGVSPDSNIVYETPPVAPTVLKLTPGPIVGGVGPNDVLMNLAWTDNATNEANYILTRKGPVATQAALATAVAGQQTTLPAFPGTGADTSIDNGPLVEGQWYEYDLVATNAWGNSAPVLTGQVLTPVYLAVPTVTFALNNAVCPTNPLVPVRCAPDDIVLSWTEPATVTGYTIDRTGGPLGTTFAQVPLSAATLTYTDKTAQEGYTYTYTVTAVNAPNKAAASVAVTTVINTPTLPTNVVVAPSTALDAKSMYVDQATITFSDNAYTDTSYNIYRALGQGATMGTPILVGTIPSSVASSANNPWGTKTTAWQASPTLTFIDGVTSPLVDGQAYTWTVQAVNTSTTATGNTMTSAPVAATMPGILINPPTFLTATPNRAGSSINLCWTDASTNETDFLVEESLSTAGGTNGTFGAWATPAGSPVNRTAAQATAVGGAQVCFGRANVPTTPGYVYNFRISARNLANHSDSHPYATISANLNAPLAPVAVTVLAPVLTATATGGERVALTWNKLTPAAGINLSYVVYANGVRIATVAQPALATATTVTFRYNVPLATTSQIISYTVAAVATAVRPPAGTVQTVFGSTTGPLSTAVSATVPAAPANSLPAPTGITPTVNPTTGAVTLAWTAVTGGPVGSTISYRVSVNGAAAVTLASGGVLNVARGAISQVQVATAFRTAAGVTTIGAYSNPVAVNTLPAQSTGLSALLGTATAAGTPISVNWANTSTNLTGWTIQRGVTGAAGAVTWTAITPTLNLSGTTYGFTDTVSALGTYSYRVLATSAAGSTAYVTSGAVTTPLPAPTGITPAVNAATGAVTLSWTAVTPPTGSTVSYRVSVNGGAAVTLASGGVLNVAAGATYSVAVATAMTVGGVTTIGAYSAPVTVNTRPAQSTALTNALAPLPAVARTFNVGFTNTSTNITGWIIQRGVSATAAGAVTWTTIAVTPTAVGTAYTFSNLAPAAGFYRFRIQATSAAGSTAIVTTPTVQTP
jgi:hypothetical protein